MRKQMTELFRKVTTQDIRHSLAVAWTVLSFLFLYKLLSKEIPEANKDVVMTIGGVVVGQLVGIMGYFFTQSKTEVDDKKHQDQA